MKNFYQLSHLYNLFKNECLPKIEDPNLNKLYDSFKNEILLKTKEKSEINLESHIYSEIVFIVNNLINEIKKTLNENYNIYQKEISQLIVECVNSLNPHKEIMMFPEGTKFLHRNENHSIVVIEQKPQIRTCFFKDFEKSKYRLAFPYCVFILIFDSENELDELYLAFRNHPLVNIQNFLYHAALPNIKELKVCPGDFSIKDTLSLTEKCEVIINNFWNSHFKDDGWMDNLQRMQKKEKRINKIKTWEKNSEKNPLFVLDVEWESAGKLVSFFANLAIDFSDLFVSDRKLGNLENELIKIWDASENTLLAKRNFLIENFLKDLKVSTLGLVRHSLEKTIKTLDEEFEKGIKKC
jgi:hypothetical protein